MTTKEKLNSILRLRLFFSTEEELSKHIGYKLKGNHFSKFKDFQGEAYFNQFAKMCESYIKDGVGLAVLLEQYEATSKFYVKNIRGKKYKGDKAFLNILLDCTFLGYDSADDVQDRKLRELVAEYREEDSKELMNVSILLLLTHELLPTFTNKAAQDVKDIIGDFQTVYGILKNIALANKARSITVFDELGCLKEISRLIKEEQEGDRFLNRMLLILLTQDVLERIYGLTNPKALLEYSQKHPHLNLPLPRFWRDDRSAENVVWEFYPMSNAFTLYRNEIDYANKQIKFAEYQIVLHEIDDDESCLSIILRPSYVYNNILHREQTEATFTSDYTEIGFDEELEEVDRLTFLQDSPLGGPMEMTAIKEASLIEYYSTYIDHLGVASDFADVCTHPESYVSCESLDVAVADDFILFKFDEDIYRLDKYDADGNETIEGVSLLTQKHGFFYVELKDGGQLRCFLSLDSINNNLEINELLKQPYFYKVDSLENLF